MPQPFDIPPFKPAPQLSAAHLNKLRDGVRRVGAGVGVYESGSVKVEATGGSTRRRRGGLSALTRVGVMIEEAAADYGTGFALLLDAHGEPLNANEEHFSWPVFDEAGDINTESSYYDEEEIDAAKVEVVNPNQYEALTVKSRVWLSSHTLEIRPGARSVDGGSTDGHDDEVILGGMVSERDNIIQYSGCAPSTGLTGATGADGLQFTGTECPEPEEE